MSADIGSHIALGLTWFLVFLFSTTLHEAAHALVAYRLGDPTAYQGGQVSLNPLPHIRREPFGMIVVPLVTFIARGWMMGWASAPFNPEWAERYPRRAGLMALAGPTANLSLVLLSGLLIRLGVALQFFEAPDRISFTAITAAGPHTLAAGLVVPLSLLFSLNLLLFVFNLIPVPPLDGSGALALLMSPDLGRRYQHFIRQPMFSVMGLVIAWRFFDLQRPLLWSLRLLYPGMAYGIG
jgi:Zn-dependent protease